MALTLDQLQLALLAVGSYKAEQLSSIKVCESAQVAVTDLRIEVLELSKLELSLGKEMFEVRQLTLALSV